MLNISSISQSVMLFSLHKNRKCFEKEKAQFIFVEQVVLTSPKSYLHWFVNRLLVFLIH